jgi:site-specific recombinase XerD
VTKTGWRVRYVLAELPEPVSPLPFVAELPGSWPDWLKECGVAVGTPYLISPSFEYDVELNAFFRSVEMVGDAWNTQIGYARDVMAFLDFLWTSRGARSWRDATEADHTAYLTWRRKDENGPRIADSTWDREVAAVNRFYRWQVRAGNLAGSPIPQRERRAMPTGAGRGRRGETVSGEIPATYSHGAGRERIEWLPAASYRRWRDVGMRGYTPDGLPDPQFRGRWAGRNSTFCDLMVRTGLRLAEQTALTVFEVPLQRGVAGYQRFWLPPVIAKGGSARWIYVPASIVAELVTYADIDRADIVEDARAAGRYQRVRRPLVVEDRGQPVVRSAEGHRVKLAQLTPDERHRLLVDGPNGLEPAAFSTRGTTSTTTNGWPPSPCWSTSTDSAGEATPPTAPADPASPFPTTPQPTATYSSSTSTPENYWPTHSKPKALQTTRAARTTSSCTSSTKSEAGPRQRTEARGRQPRNPGL